VTDDSTEPESRDERVDAVILAYLEAADAGQAPDPRALLARHPDLADELRAFFADHDRVGRLARGKARPGETADDTTTPPDRGPAPLPPPAGGYRPLRLLGAGGMGRVYEAEDPSGRRVALKLLAPGIAGSRTAVERFRQEGRLAGRVTHPRCVFVFKADAEAGQPYIAMELMSGTTLKDLVERDGPLPVGAAVARVLDVIDGLAEAHRAGVLHRDVKPANCYVEADGRVKVGDFGLSRSLTANLHLTRTGAFVGTPLFASPEQLKGEPLDVRTDVYSVAATLYYLLTGQAPFQGAEGVSLVVRVVSEPAPPPRTLRPDLPPALEAVVLRGLERQRQRRYPDLDELRAALLPLLPGRLTIAGVGLRLGAYFLDSLPFGVVGSSLALALGPGAQLDCPVYLALVAPIFLYFALGDGLWGGTPGKRLVRLRVTRGDGSEPPGLWRGLGREAVFLGVSGTALNLLVGAVWGRLDPSLNALIQIPGTFLGLALCFSTMRARNGYRGLHELLSGTRVVQLPPLPAPASRKSVPAGDDQGSDPSLSSGIKLMPSPTVVLPRQIGPFAIRGALRWDGSERLLLGEDASLERLVWVRLRPPAGGPLPEGRRELARPTRLRWLAQGEWDGWHWDAFVAPAGEPLAAWVARRGPLPWSVMRSLLEQLADELQAAAADGTLPPVLSPDHVWAHAPGRVQLLDGPPAGEQPPDADRPSLDLLRQVAALALDGPRPDRPARAALPLHAQALLGRLRGERNSYRTLAELHSDLAGTRDRPAEATPVLRALQLSLSSSFLFLGVMLMLGWSRLGAVSHVLTLDRDLVQERALQYLLDDAAGRATLLPHLPAGVAPFRDRLDRRLAEDRAALAARRHGLGLFAPVYRAIPVVRLRLSPAGAEESLRFERTTTGPLPLRIIRADAPDVEPVVLDGGALARAVQGVETDSGRSREQLFEKTLAATALTLGFFPVLWVVWAFLFRGGLSLRLAGLALVRTDGRPALRVQAAWRALLVWGPVLAVLFLTAWIDTLAPELAWLCTALQGLVLLTLIGYAGLALRFPARGPHDWLAGTRLVPR
jgi:hypothetical protein